MTRTIITLALAICGYCSASAQDTTKSFTIDGKEVDWRTKEVWDYMQNSNMPTIGGQKVRIPIKRMSWHIEDASFVRVYSHSKKKIEMINIKETDDFVLLDISNYVKGIYLYEVYLNGSVKATNWFEKR